MEIVKFLIESGADINAVDIWGTTPLCYAEMYGKYLKMNEKTYSFEFIEIIYFSR